MILLIGTIIFFIIGIICIYVFLKDTWENEIYLYFGIILILIFGMALLIEIISLIQKPIDYKNFKIEYDVVAETITKPEDIRDSNYTKKIIELNTTIMKNREWMSNKIVGIFYNKKIAELELLEKENTNE